MDTEQLKLIVELFSNVTDGAVTGGITFLAIDLLKSVIPWFVIGYVLKLLIGTIAKIQVIKQSER